MTIDLLRCLTPEIRGDLSLALWGSRDLALECTLPGAAQHGQNGVKQLLDVTSARGSIRVFLKVLAPTLREAATYRLLAKAQAPIARLLAAGDHAGEEVVVLEHLACIGIGEPTPLAFGDYLDTLARFTACQVQELPEMPAAWMDAWLEALQQAWQCARGGSWGSSMAGDAAVLDGAWPTLRGIALDLAEHINQLPQVTTHHDVAYGNIGRRSPGSPLVFIDLHYCSRFPWGRDLALALGGFAQPWPDQDGPRPWIVRYCEAYQRHSGTTLGFDAHRAVAQQLAAYRCWFDAPTLQAAQAAHEHDQERFQQRWGSWLGRTWSTLGGWVHRGQALDR